MKTGQPDSSRPLKRIPQIFRGTHLGPAKVELGPSTLSKSRRYRQQHKLRRAPNMALTTLLQYISGSSDRVVGQAKEDTRGG